MTITIAAVNKAIKSNKKKKKLQYFETFHFVHFRSEISILDRFGTGNENCYSKLRVGTWIN